MSKKIEKELEKALISEQEQLYEVPESWNWVRIESINFKGSQLKPDKTFSYIDIGSIDNKNYKVVKPKNINPEDAPSRARKVVEEGSIVYSTVRPYLKNIAIVPKLNNPIASTGFCVLNSRNPIVNNYLFLFLQSGHFTKQMEKKQSGANYPAVRDNDVFSEIIPFPPLLEQKRIIECIKSSFEHIHKVEKNLSLTKELIHKRHESLLTKAFRGELVENNNSNGMASNLRKYIQEELDRDKKKKKESNHIREEELPYKIPTHWCYLRIGDIITITGGSQPPKSVFKYKYEEGYTRLVQIRDFKSNDHLTYVPDRYANRPFTEDDVMIGRYGPPVFQILRGLSGTYNVALMKAETNPNIMIKDYLYYLLQEPRIQKAVIKDSTRSAGQTGVRRELLESFVIGVPPIEEQKKIVEKLKLEFQKEKKIKLNIQSIETHLKKMRDSIFKKAFQGELVEQIPAEGTGLELLKEIIEAKVKEKELESIKKKKEKKLQV